jgi:hypothetical protein
LGEELKNPHHRVDFPSDPAKQADASRSIGADSCRITGGTRFA